MLNVRIPMASELMESRVATLTPDTNLLEAIDKLVAEGGSALCVTNPEQRILGILTEKDCLRILSLSAYETARQGKVSDFMSPLRAVIDPEMDLFRVAECFLQNHFPMLPVAREGHLVGEITRKRMLRAIQELAHEAENEVLRQESAAAASLSRPRSIEEMQRLFSRSSREQLIRRMGRKS